MTSAHTTGDRPEGRVAIVTGANRGIGAATARALALSGANNAGQGHQPKALADLTSHGDRVGHRCLSLIAVAVAMLGRRELSASALLFAVVVIQVALGVLGERISAWFGAAHGLGALVVAGAAVNLARRTPTSYRPVHHTPTGAP